MGIALQMRDGSTRAVRMSEGLVFHLKQEWTPFVLSNAADVKGEDVLRMPVLSGQKADAHSAHAAKGAGGRAQPSCMRSALHRIRWCLPRACLRQYHAQCRLPSLRLCCRAADGAWPAAPQMLDLVHLAGQSVVPADAAPELRLAANRMTLTDHDTGAAAELLYRMVRRAETSA